MALAEELTIYNAKRIKRMFLFFLIFCSFQNFYAQTFKVRIFVYNGKVYLLNLSEEKT